ncbi:MAG: hypothetical protein R3F13_05875 [Prosthecobacter sp.]
MHLFLLVFLGLFRVVKDTRRFALSQLPLHHRQLLRCASHCFLELFQVGGTSTKIRFDFRQHPMPVGQLGFQSFELCTTAFQFGCQSMQFGRALILSLENLPQFSFSYSNPIAKCSEPIAGSIRMTVLGELSGYLGFISRQPLEGVGFVRNELVALIWIEVRG